MRFSMRWIVPAFPVLLLAHCASVSAQHPEPTSAFPPGIVPSGTLPYLIGIVVYAVCNAYVSRKNAEAAQASEGEKGRLVKELAFAVAKATECEQAEAEAKAGEAKAITDRDADRQRYDQDRQRWHDRENELLVRLARKSGSDDEISTWVNMPRPPK